MPKTQHYRYFSVQCMISIPILVHIDAASSCTPRPRLNYFRSRIRSGQVGVPARAARVHHRRCTIAEPRSRPAARGRGRGHTPHRSPRDRPRSKTHVRIHRPRPPPPDGCPPALQIAVFPVELWRAATTAPLIADGSCNRRAEGGVQEAHSAPENARELQREDVARYREEEQGR